MNRIITKNSTYTYYWSHKKNLTGTGWVLEVANNKFFYNPIFSGTVNISSGSQNITLPKQGFYYFRLRRGTEVTPFDVVVYSISAQDNITLQNDKWTLLAKGSEMTENYIFEIEPAGWDIEQRHIYRTFQRNLRGDLLTLPQTAKDRIVLDFSQQQYLGEYAKSIIEYFYYNKPTFYLAKKFEDVRFGEYQRIWEVAFEDESINLERMGVTLNFIEV